MVNTRNPLTCGRAPWHKGIYPLPSGGPFATPSLAPWRQVTRFFFVFFFFFFFFVFFFFFFFFFFVSAFEALINYDGPLWRALTCRKTCPRRPLHEAGRERSQIGRIGPNSCFQPSSSYP